MKAVGPAELKAAGAEPRTMPRLAPGLRSSEQYPPHIEGCRTYGKNERLQEELLRNYNAMAQLQFSLFISSRT